MYVTVLHNINKPVLFGFMVILLVSLFSLSISIQKPTVVQGSLSSSSSTTANDEDKAGNLSIYENSALGFSIKYPADFIIVDVSDNPVSTTVTFEKPPIAASGGIFLSIGVVRGVEDMTLDELTHIMLDSIKINSGTQVLENTTSTLDGIPAHKIVLRHKNSPIGLNAIGIFIEAVRDNISYTISSLTTDKLIIQKMINSFKFTK